MTENIFHKIKLESDSFMKERRSKKLALQIKTCITTIIAALIITIIYSEKSSEAISRILDLNQKNLLISLTLPILAMAITLAILRGSKKRIDSINKNQDLEEPETTLILSRLERLERKLSSKDNLEKHSLPITPETQDRIISIAAEVYGNDLLEDAKRKIEETAQERIENQKNIRIFQEIANRLLIEIESQKTKSIINLIIGILFATIGISALFYFFITPTINQHENNSATLELIQRSSFVLLIEVLAYFFLNLHKREARETRYYQNEITNIQLKLIATNLAAENNTSKDSIIKELARAERNFILEKGQTTTDLEKDRISTTSENDLTRLISSISYPKSQRRQ